MNRLVRLHNRWLPGLAAGLLVLLGLWLALAPAESRLGQVVKVVYVHGALVMVGLVAFTVAGAIGLVALAARRPAWYRGVRVAAVAALLIWIAYALSSMVVTGLTWGQIVAWGEPRVRASAMILLAAIVLNGVAWLLKQRELSAAINAVMGIVPWIVVQRAEAIRHPIDPIGGSGSAAMQGFYLLIVLTVAALAATLIAWLWLGAELKERNRESV